jgi:hypothetical protein
VIAPLPPPPPAGSAPFNADNFGSSTASAHPRAPAEWIADRMDAPATSAPIADSTAHRKDPSAEEDVLVAAPLRVGGPLVARKTLLMIGGGVAVLALVLVVALSRGGSSAQQTHGRTSASGVAAGKGHAGSAATDDDDATATSMKLPSHGHGGAAIASAGTATAAGSADETAGSADTGSGSAVALAEPVKEPEAETAPAPAKHHPTLGGKQVVLEYDNPTHETPHTAAAPREDSAAVEHARASYAAGNQKLFAGDAAGAVRAYQQSLAYYPGYVAGYRGLGLAYSQEGDKTKALQAFHTYLSSVPGAKDAPLIRKRVTALSH